MNLIFGPLQGNIKRKMIEFHLVFLHQIGEVKVPLCMVDLAQTIEEWKDIQSVKVDDQVGRGDHDGDNDGDEDEFQIELNNSIDQL